MCLSAAVSFSTSAVLAIIGTVLVSKVKSKRLLPLALIPYFFAIQQSAEGIVWLQLPEVSQVKNVYLFFAYVFWPIWVPFSLWFAENEEHRKQLLAILLGIGIATGLFLFFLISGTVAQPYRGSIHYLRPSTLAPLDMMGVVFYGAATVGSLFISSLRKIRIYGCFVAVLGIATALIDQYLFISVWCFTAAVSSVFIYFIIKKNHFDQ